MFGPQHLFVDAEGALEQRPRGSEIALGLQQIREVDEAGRGVRMLGPQHLRGDGEVALEQRPRGGEIALGLQQAREVGEAGRGVRMFGPQHLFGDREVTLEQRSRGGEIALRLQQPREAGDCDAGLRMARAAQPFVDGKRTFEQRTGGAICRRLLAILADVDQHRSEQCAGARGRLVVRAEQRGGDRVQAAAARPGFGVEHVLWIGGGEGGEQAAFDRRGGRGVASPEGGHADQAVQADCFGGYRGVAFVRDRLGVHQGETAQGGDRAFQASAFQEGGQSLGQRRASFGEEEQRDRFGGQGRGGDEQFFGGGIARRGGFDGQCEGFRHRQAVMIGRGGGVRVAQHLGRGGGEAREIGRQGQAEFLAIGSGHFVRQRQAVERGREGFGRRFVGRAGSLQQKSGADVGGPEADFHCLRHVAPAMRVGGDQDVRGAVEREEGTDAFRVQGVVEDQQDALAFAAQAVGDFGQSGVLGFAVGDPAQAVAERDEVGAEAVGGFGAEPPGGAVVVAMFGGVGGGEHGFADAAHAAQRGDGGAAVVALQGGLDGRHVVVAAHEDAGDGDGYVAFGGDVLAGEGDGERRGGRGHEGVEALAGGVLGQAVKFAALEVLNQRRQHAGRDHDIEHEAGTLFLDRAPFRGFAFQGGVAGLQIGVRHHAQHMVRAAVPGAHPAEDVLALADLPFMHVRGMAERCELVGDPVRPLAVGAGVADEDVGHGAVSDGVAGSDGRAFLAAKQPGGTRVSRHKARPHPCTPPPPPR